MNQRFVYQSVLVLLTYSSDGNGSVILFKSIHISADIGNFLI